MILILAEQKDVSTDYVIEWLEYTKTPYLRVNTGWNMIEKLDLGEVNDICLKNGLKFSELTAVWFRRGYFLFYQKRRIEQSEFVERKIDRHLKEEIQTLTDYTYHLLKTIPSVNHPQVYNASKLVVLHKAQQHGLKIPKTLVTEYKSAVQIFKEEEEAIITKNIQDVISIPLENQRVGNATKLVDAEHLESASDNFFYSLFQKAISKRYELRVFYFLGDFYSCAIFSQLNAETKEDNRLEQKARPNRVVPYELPQVVKSKLHALMQDLQMESGSIDLIVDDKFDYYFIEVNPVGQFDYVARRCNYPIEKMIAHQLKKLHEKGCHIQ
jgi:ATP-GRASP peptide maturase of grasp-with-spasm system